MEWVTPLRMEAKMQKWWPRGEKPVIPVVLAFFE